ncbi:hypothetical protein A3841_08970 [Pontibacter flavimaris]|uniref:Uncharacterized protein n=1 Tax=Pontibacter flavimaris TaxID=1797110 RepID=A0A1Q5PIR5_9BACT|nr:hypothetical protein A3841_08970 [Pontibacter flavimaris]
MIDISGEDDRCFFWPRIQYRHYPALLTQEGWRGYSNGKDITGPQQKLERKRIGEMYIAVEWLRCLALVSSMVGYQK